MERNQKIIFISKIFANRKPSETIPTSEKSMLTIVAFRENLISTSFEGVLFCEVQNFGVFDSKVKYEKIGKSKSEGRLRKVLRTVLCQMKKTPVIRPGRMSAARHEVVVMRELVKAEIKIALLSMERRQARRTTRNLGERRPPSGSTLQTPS